MKKMVRYKYWIVCGLSIAFCSVLVIKIIVCERAHIGTVVTSIVPSSIGAPRPSIDPVAELYADGRKQLIFDAYDVAISLFHEYLENYPDYKNAPDAQYWLGVAFLSKGDITKAITTFQNFQERYPLHPKFDDSMHDLAQVYIALNEVEVAKVILSGLLDKCHQDYFLCNKVKNTLSKLEVVDAL